MNEQLLTETIDNFLSTTMKDKKQEMKNTGTMEPWGYFIVYYNESKNFDLLKIPHIADFFQSPSAKDQLANFIEDVYETMTTFSNEVKLSIKLSAVIVGSDAYYISRPAESIKNVDENNMELPSKAIDRKEAIMVLVSTENKTDSYWYCYSRTGGVITFEKETVHTVALNDVGRFKSLFPKKTQTT